MKSRNKTFICGKDAELVPHLLLHCSMAYQLWVLIFYMFGHQVWVQHGTIQEVLHSWRGVGLGRGIGRRGL